MSYGIKLHISGDLTAADGKQRMTDVADTEQLLRLIPPSMNPSQETSFTKNEHSFTSREQ